MLNLPTLPLLCSRLRLANVSITKNWVILFKKIRLPSKFCSYCRRSRCCTSVNKCLLLFNSLFHQNVANNNYKCWFNSLPLKKMWILCSFLQTNKQKKSTIVKIMRAELKQNKESQKSHIHRNNLIYFLSFKLSLSLLHHVLIICAGFSPLLFVSLWAERQRTGSHVTELITTLQTHHHRKVLA